MAGQPLDIRFSRGIDAQNDARAVEQPFLLKADNIFFDAEKGPKKRSGYMPLTNLTATANGIAPSPVSSTSVINHKEEILTFDDAYMYAYSDNMGGWINRGAFVPTAASLRPASPTSENQVFCDAVSYGTAWELLVYKTVMGGAGTLYFSVRDKTTGGYLRYNEIAATSMASLPQWKLVRTISGFLLVYLDGTTIYARPINTNVMSSTFIGAPVVVATPSLSSVSGLFDVTFDGQYTAMVLQSGDAQLDMYSLNPNGTPAYYRRRNDVPTGAMTALNITPANSLATTSLGNFTVSYAMKTAAFPGSQQVTCLQYSIYLPTGTTLGPLASTTFAGVVSVNQMAAIRFGGDTNYYTLIVFRLASGAGPYTDTGQYGARLFRGPGLDFPSSTNVLNSAVLASRPFLYNGQAYAFMSPAPTRLLAYAYNSGTGTPTTAATSQGSAYLVNLAANTVVAQLGYGVTAVPDQSATTVMGYGITAATGQPPPNVMVGANNLFEVPIPKTVKLVASASSATQFDAINYYYMYGVKFVSANQVQSTQFGDVRVFTGGITRLYDGSAVTEQGFFAAPEIIDISFTGGIVGSIAAGTYYLCAIYEWTDRQGNLHRSAPGPTTTLTMNSTASVVPAISMTSVPTSKMAVNVALYATKVGGTLFYRVASGPVGTPITNYALPSGNNVAAETLYTTGGILPNDPWGNNSLMAASRNRVFMAGGEDSDLLGYSKAYVKGEGLSYSLAFTKRISSVPGSITALATMDDKIIVFKTRAILYFYGQNGPSTDGSNDDFSPSQVLTTEVGCVAKGSILTTSDGVYFQSEKGIWLLSRSMNLTFVGQPIAPLTAGKTITSAVLTAKQTTVRFGTLDGSTFVYHYRLQGPFGDSLQCGQWTTFSNYKQYAATLHRGVYCFARADGRVCLDQENFYKDDAQPISFTLTTAWLRAGGLLQWGQFTDLALLGLYQGPHALMVRVYRDYLSAPDTVLKFNSFTGVTTTLWGSDPSWGSRSPFGGDFDDSYVARWRLPRSCAAVATISFSISDTGVLGTDLGATCQLVGINLLGQAQNELIHTGDKKRQ